jgi:hypothetical protein
MPIGSGIAGKSSATVGVEVRILETPTRYIVWDRIWYTQKLHIHHVEGLRLELRSQLLCKPDVLEDRQIRAAVLIEALQISGQTEKLQDSSRGIVDSPSSSNFHCSESEIDF